MLFRAYSHVITISTLLLFTLIVNALPIAFSQSLSSLEYEHLEHLYSRAAKCSADVDLKGLEELPSWHKVVAYAEEHWGKGGGIHLNPSEYPDRGIEGCLGVDRVEAQWEGEEECSSEEAEQHGQTMNGELTIGWKTQLGTNARTVITVTKGITTTPHLEAEVTVGIPEVSKIQGKFSIEVAFKNEKLYTTEATDIRMTEQTFTFKNDANKTCKFSVTTTTCSATAIARVPVVIQGRVWFFYHNARRDLTKPDDPKEHFHWSVDIAKVLSEEERTTYVELRGRTDIQSRTGYYLHCTPIGELPEGLILKAF